MNVNKKRVLKWVAALLVLALLAGGVLYALAQRKAIIEDLRRRSEN